MAHTKVLSGRFSEDIASRDNSELKFLILFRSVFPALISSVMTSRFTFSIKLF
uniref:Uncharacterized protein n=1 Tax=Parascaris equorum TaxID=6256 RepID=A0A914RX59_PAREQ